MEKSEQIKDLATALSSFQGEMEFVGYDANNPFFKSKYATLTALVTKSKEMLNKHGLSVSQLLEGECGVTTLLMHISGQWISSTVTLKPVKQDPQGLGSAITYARRYAYASILGLVSDNDDDANHATFGRKDEIPQYTHAERVEIEGIKKFGSKEKFKEWLKTLGFIEMPIKDMDLAVLEGKIINYKKA